MAALLLRRASRSPRDRQSVARLCGLDGEVTWDDDSTALLLAELGGRAVGLARLRIEADLVPSRRGPRVWVDALFVDASHRRQGIGRALLDACRHEAEAREAVSFGVRLDEVDEGAAALLARAGFQRAPRASVWLDGPAPATRAAAATRTLRLGNADVRVTPCDAPSLLTRWSGGRDVRARAPSDLAAPAWSVEGLVGTSDDEGDGARFDPASRALRELYLRRPLRHAVADAPLRAIAAIEASPAHLTLAPEVTSLALPSREVALFDTSLAALVALDAAALAACGDDARGVSALAVGDGLALLVCDERCVGWRLTDPIAHVRPMGWPDAREAPPLDGDAREALGALLYDWMVIDALPRIDPVGADGDEIAHMVALRDRARALVPEGALPSDRVAGVARDIAAHVHWSWGFFRVGE